jgi:diguanylate cyclase (GGDEF)-like protein
MADVSLRSGARIAMIAQNPRWSDWIRASASLGLSAILFAIYRAALADPLLLQFWPVALAPLYGTRRRLLIELCWGVAVILIATAGWPDATLDDWHPLARIAGAVGLVSLTALGIMALSAREHRLRLQAYVDPLTGLLNRRSFLELSGKEEARVRRRDYELAVMMVDIDHFKSVNDTHGHGVGDVVLRRLAEICARTLRPSDIVARYGGEEFVISLPETGLEAARLVADRLRFAVSQATILTDGAEVRFTISIGIATCTRTSPLAAAIRSADEALYAAKHNGRNRVELAGMPATADAPVEPARSPVADIIVPPRTNGAGAVAPPPGAQGTILVVDDEEDIRTLIAEWLAGHGYKVLVAGCAGDALALIEADDTIELLCTDIVMPGDLNGFDLARRAEEIRPGMKLLYMSAYSVAETVRAAQGEATPLVRKPFRLDYLLETIESALQA